MSSSTTAETGPLQSLNRPLAIIAILAAATLTALVLAAMLRHLVAGGRPFPQAHAVWLTLHLASVVPAIPLGAVVLFRRKGDARHRLLGRLWALLMLVAAGSSLGLGQPLSWLHALSALTLFTIPRGVLAAMRGEIGRHRRLMLVTFSSLVVAGFFTLLPQRLLGGWLFGVS